MSLGNPKESELEIGEAVGKAGQGKGPDHPVAGAGEIRSRTGELGKKNSGSCWKEKIHTPSQHPRSPSNSKPVPPFSPASHHQRPLHNSYSSSSSTPHFNQSNHNGTRTLRATSHDAPPKGCAMAAGMTSAAVTPSSAMPMASEGRAESTA